MKFLVQKIDGKIVHDFAFELTQAEDYYRWLGNEELEIRWTMNINFPSIKNPDDYIPVGSVDFVRAYMRKFYPEAAAKALKPLNVPELFYPAAGRSIGVFDMSKDNPASLFYNQRKVYCKSTHTIKADGNGLYFMDALPKAGQWQMSEYLSDLESEWRVFVFNGTIQHIANYSGNCLVFPDAERIRELVKMWQMINPNEVPKAYTLDVAISKERGTIVLECHRFFSCGLYGFCDHAKIPKMLSQEWHNMINNPLLK